MDIIHRLINYWCHEILKGAPQVPMAQLTAAAMPEPLRLELTRHAEAGIQGEITHVLSNPIFGPASSAEADPFRRQLFELLLNRLMITEPFLKETIEKVFRSFLEGWRMEPINLRQAMENPVGFADEVFKRAEVIAANGATARIRYPLDVLAIVCHASGLKPLSDAIKIEQELAVNVLDREEFVILTRRLIMLKARYSLTRRLVAYEGTGKTIAEALSKEKPTALVAPVAPPPVAAEPAAPVPDVPPTAPKPAPIGETAPKPPRPGLDEGGELLYNALMAEENLAFFTEVLFDKDSVAFQRMAYQVSRQKKMVNALTLADNELFVREIPSHAVAAQKLMSLIRNNFHESQVVQ